MCSQFAKIYECNGLAGCGKSTLVDMLADNLMSKKEVLVVGVDTFRNLQGNQLMKLLSKVYRVLLLFKPRNFLFSYLCFKFLRSGKTWLKYENFIAVLYCVYLYDSYRRYSNDSRIILSDEGSVQSLTTLSLMCDGNLDIINQLMNKFYDVNPNVVYICCNITIEESLHRMIKRNRNNSAIDKMDIVHQKLFLRDYNIRLRETRSWLKPTSKHNVDMTKYNNSLIDSIIEWRS